MSTIHLFPTLLSANTTMPKGRAIVLGTNEVASAIAVALTKQGIRVALSHDPMPPVIRRRMSFHDSLFGELTSVDDIWGINCDQTLEILEEFSHGSRVVVTRLGLSHLLPVGRFDLIVDARMHKTTTMPMLRYLAPVTIGLGPGFIAGENCDVAIETHPDFLGQILTTGETLAADGIPSALGTMRQERFVYSQVPGRWSTHREIGEKVFRGTSLGILSGHEILAPQDGVLRGIVRDGTEVPQAVKLLEIDPRGRNAQWQGLDQRSYAIAKATLNAFTLMAQHLHRT